MCLVKLADGNVGSDMADKSGFRELACWSLQGGHWEGFQKGSLKQTELKKQNPFLAKAFKIYEKGCPQKALYLSHL